MPPVDKNIKEQQKAMNKGFNGTKKSKTNLRSITIEEILVSYKIGKITLQEAEYLINRKASTPLT